ncbi:MAG: hypothetical protein ACRDZX_03480, partial [Acidimicrobiales bacterium]
SYTAAGYEALAGYGTTLPPLPPYLAAASGGVATIYAPGQAVSLGSYHHPGQPELFFFEGGAYSLFGAQALSGDQYIGGAATTAGTYYAEPIFDEGWQGQEAVAASQDGYRYAGSATTLATLAPAGATSLSLTSALGASVVYFADAGTLDTYKVAAGSGTTTLELSSPLLAAESAGTTVWSDNDDDFGGAISSAAAGSGLGSPSLSLARSQIPMVEGESLVVGAGNASTQSVTVASVSGGDSGYTLMLSSPLTASVPAGAPVFYEPGAGGVTVEYLDIANSVMGTQGTIYTGNDWTVEHDYVHDGYAGGANAQSTNADGTALDTGGGQGYDTIEYNCFARMGEYALNGGGTGTVFDYNQVDETPYQPDLSGNGQSGCGKWWGSTNNDVVDDAFTDERYSACVWFDNGNTGMLVEGNYFYDLAHSGVGNETGYNSEYLDNLFEDVSTGISLNDSGGWDIPGSRYNGQVLVKGNIFDNDLEAIDIWGASGRSCLNSGEEAGDGSAPYCSGGFPHTDPYFDHYHDSSFGQPLATVAQGATCSLSDPCGTASNPLVLEDVPPLDDYIGFQGDAPDAATDGPAQQTATSQATDVTTFTGGAGAGASPATAVTVASTAGFPPSGQLVANTSDGSWPLSTGAVLAYTGTTATSFTGVSWVSGAGSLTGTLMAVQPYQVTGVSCPGEAGSGNGSGACNYPGTATADVVTTPAICSSPATCPGGGTSVTLGTGTAVDDTGTCPYYATATASPTSPMAPALSDGTDYSYYDGCMWEDRDITVEANTFYLDAAQFNAAAYPGGGGTWGQEDPCTTGPSGNCGEVITGYQYPGADARPWSDAALSNAMMSDGGLAGSLANLNLPGSPLLGSGEYQAPSNGEKPYDDIFEDNTYAGPWAFQAYTQQAACPVSWSGGALSWSGSGGGGNACGLLTLPQWQAYWGQDAGSSA